jgi:hypothetical protein
MNPPLKQAHIPGVPLGGMRQHGWTGSERMEHLLATDLATDDKKEALRLVSEGLSTA